MVSSINRYKNLDPNRPTEYREPYIHKVDSMDRLLEEWRFTRPYLSYNEAKKEIKGLEQIDLPVKGMRSYIFEIQGSILFRDILYSIRPITAAWARSQRTVPFDQDNLFLSSEYKGINDSELQSLMKKVYTDLKSGVPQDIARKSMPMACSSQYSINIDERTLISFIKMLHDHNEVLYNVYGKLFIDAMGKTEDQVLSVHSSDIFDKYSISDEEYKYSENGGFATRVADEFIGVYTLQGNLMAQFVRQTQAHVKNSLFNMIDNHGDTDNYKLDYNDSLLAMSKINVNTELVVAVYVNSRAFLGTLKRRASWFAQFDKEDNSSWSSIVGPYVKNMTPSEFKKFVGGVNGDDPFKKDLLPRVYGIEVNPPSPFLLEMPSLVQTRREQLGSDSVVFKKWQELADSGLINDNPDNPYRKIYEEVVRTGKPYKGPDPE